MPYWRQHPGSHCLFLPTCGFMARQVRRLPERVVRQLPHTVRATQWQPGRQLTGIVVENPARPGVAALLPLPAYAIFRTPLGSYTVFAGDWIVTEPTGRRHVVSNEQFARRYVAVEGEDDLFIL